MIPMPVTILSPYSGQPVKVRDQDVGRAIRDEQKRIFYMVEGDDGQGYYASKTRQGSETDQHRYRELASNGPPAQSQGQAEQPAVHDATGRTRRNPVGLIMLVLVLLAMIGAAYVYFVRPDLLPGGDQPQPATHQPAEPTQTEPTPSNDTTHVPASPDVRPPTTIRVSSPPTGHDDTPDDVEPLAVPTWHPGSQTATATSSARGSDDPFRDFHISETGLRYKTHQPGEGARAVAGSFVEVRYAVYSLDGQALVDDARQTFVLMTGQAIRALEEGLAGMRAGGQRELLVPRGHSDQGSLPGLDRLPNAAFVIDLQLISVRSGVTHIVEQAGQGEIASPGDVLELRYQAWVAGDDQQPFDSSDQRGGPMRLTLGRGTVIAGLEAGLIGIQLGETRLLTIPPYMAYGSHGFGGGLVPPDAMINYRVSVESIQPPSQSPDDRS